MKPDGSQVFHVREAEVGQSLVGALKRWLHDSSWGQVRKLVGGRRVQINGNLCLDEGRRLTEGEVVKVLAHAMAAPPREEDVKIRYVDAHVVVVEKPAGVTTLRHSEEQDWPDRRKQRQPTLDELLPKAVANYLMRQSRKGRGGQEGDDRRRGRDDRAKRQAPPLRVPRLRPVHRLDRDTSGLMVFARTVPAERALVQQFRKHSIHRAYRAVVHGEIEPQTIESQLVRDRGDGRRGSTKLENVGQRAVTHVRPIERLGAYTLIECRLETGRTHQIRIHLSENGHFVCGDKVYCQPLFKKPLHDRSGAPRLALHAFELGFVHPITGEQLHFEMPFPPDLAEFLKRLRGQGGKLPDGKAAAAPTQGAQPQGEGQPHGDVQPTREAQPARAAQSNRTTQKPRTNQEPRAPRERRDHDGPRGRKKGDFRNRGGRDDKRGGRRDRRDRRGS